MASAALRPARIGRRIHRVQTALARGMKTVATRVSLGWSALVVAALGVALFAIFRGSDSDPAATARGSGLAGTERTEAGGVEPSSTEQGGSTGTTGPRRGSIRIAYAEGQLARNVRFDAIDGAVSITNIERDPIGDIDWESESRYPVSFQGCRLAARTSHEIYVAGLYESGMTVLELWRFSPVTGEYRSTRPRATTGIGSPFVTPHTSFSIVGGTFQEPEARTKPMHMRRTIWSGTTLGVVKSMVADPDGRFLLVYSSDQEALYMVPTGQGAQPTLVHNSMSVPAMASGLSLTVGDHAALGRTYMLSLLPSSGNHCILLPDYDNDGVLDDCIVYDVISYANDGIGPGWIRNFRTTF